MLESAIPRYCAVILGTVLWDLGAVLQKKAVGKLSADRLPVASLLGSPGWMLGLLITALGWGLFVFGLDRMPISTARTITAGSYVILALFSYIFLRTPLSLVEWAAVACVTAGIVLLGLRDVSGPASPSAERVLFGLACTVLLSLAIFMAPRLLGRSPRASLFAFAALSGLLGSAGDLLTKVLLLFLQKAPFPAAGLVLAAAGLIAFYLAGFYMLSRAYQVGTVMGGVVVSDFFGRVGVLFLGWLSLSEPLGGAGPGGLERALGLLLVLGGSLLLGRFAASPGAESRPGQSAPTCSG